RAVVVVDRVDRGDPSEAGAVGDRVTSGAGHRPAAAHHQREREREQPGAIRLRASDGVTWYGDLITYRLEREPPPKRRNGVCADREGSAAACTNRASVRAPRSPTAAAGVRTTPNTPPTRRATTAPRRPECAGTPARGGIARRPPDPPSRPRSAPSSVRCRRRPRSGAATLPTECSPRAVARSSARGGTTRAASRAPSRGSRIGSSPA